MGIKETVEQLACMTEEGFTVQVVANDNAHVFLSVLRGVFDTKGNKSKLTIVYQLP